MGQIKFNEITTTKPDVSNIFDVPTGLEDQNNIVSLEKDDLADAEPGVIGINDALEQVQEDNPDAGVVKNGPIQPPRNIIVFGENVSFGPDKTHVVDVTLKFDDVAGANRYEVKVAKRL